MSPRPRPTHPVLEPMSPGHPSQPTAQLTGASPQNDAGHGRRFDVSVPQILAGALATAAAALAASSLGVAGTVVGAVVMSVVASISTALFIHPIQRSTDVIRETLPISSERSRSAGVTVAEAPRAVDPTAADIGVFDAAVPDRQRALRPAPVERRVLGGLRWGLVAVSSLATLVIGLGVLTGFELVLGRSAASLTGSGSQDGPTITHLVDVTSPLTTDDDADPLGPGSTGPTVVEPPREESGSTPDRPTSPTGGQPAQTPPAGTPPTAEPTGPSIPAEPQPSEPEPTDLPVPTQPPSEPLPTEPQPTEPPPTS